MNLSIRCLLVFALISLVAPSCLSAVDSGSELSESSREVMRALVEQHRSQAQPGHEHNSGMNFCFAPGTTERYMQQVAIQASSQGLSLSYRLDEAPAHWEFTATDGSNIQRGDSITLTWGIVPDGTHIPAFSSGAAANSNLRARLDALYGNESVWLPLFQQVFDRWEELTGITYVYEPNDDGADFTTSTVGGNAAPGILGVRPDVRIGGRPIDGNFGTLAFNFGAPNGEMVIDTNDNAFDGMENNSRLFRNMLSHEHGHGLGLNHTCPVNETKVMEPTVPDMVDGPQHDDILGAQRQHGDPYEDNDSFGKATDLGSLADGNHKVNTILNGAFLSLDGNDDVDIFQFTLPSAGKNLAVTLTPIGESYLEAAQNPNGTCPPGVLTDSRLHQDLGIEVVGSDASTVLGRVDLNGVGGTETLIDIPLAGGTGPFFVRVFGGAEDDVQMYEVDLVIGEGQTGTLHSFRFDALGSGQSVGVGFQVGIDAVDVFNGPVASFTDTVDLSVVSKETVLIAEIDPGSIDRVEFCNVADRTIDISGWQIVIYDAGSASMPDVIITLPALSSVTSGEVFTVTENGAAPGALPNLFSGTDIDWSPNSSSIAVLLLDSGGNVVDFATLGESSSITSPVLIPADQWSGPGIMSSASDTYQRTGASDSNSNVDWSVASETFGTKSSGLTTPFPARSIAFSPTTTSAFVAGEGSVSVTFSEPGDSVVLKADDGAGHVGYSAPFDVGLINDISVELVAAPSSVRAGETITYTATVRNAGPNEATMVTLTSSLPANTVFVSAFSSQGSAGESGGIVTANLGTITGGGSATVTINLSASMTGTLMNTVMVTRGESDAYAPNNTASTDVLVVEGPDHVEEFNAFTGMTGFFPDPVSNDTATQFESINFTGTTAGSYLVDTALSQNGRGLLIAPEGETGMWMAEDLPVSDYTTPSHMIAFWFRFSSVAGTDHMSQIMSVYNRDPLTVNHASYTLEVGVNGAGEHGMGVIISSLDTFFPASGINDFNIGFAAASPDVWHRCVIHYTSASSLTATDGSFKLWIDPSGDSSEPQVSFPDDRFEVASANGVGALGRYGLGRSVGFPIEAMGPDMFIDSIGSWGGFGMAGANDLQAGVDFLNSSIPNLAIAATSASKDEGDSGTTQFDFTITRTGPNALATTVNYEVTGTGANPADTSDFGGSFPSGSVMFAAGETSKSVAIQVSGDDTVESTEEFAVTISVPVGGVVINTDSASGTIQNDDVEVTLFDFGDAPDPLLSTGGQYPTLLANDGARHVIVMGAPRLGSELDDETDGQPHVGSEGDDSTGGNDDEDGVAAPTLVLNSTVVIPVTVSAAAGKLDAWIDYNQNGVWESPSEQIATDLSVSVGTEMLMVNVPANANAGFTVARFRISSAGGLQPTGQAADGEVEDHRVAIISGAVPAANHIAVPMRDEAGNADIVFVGDADTAYTIEFSTNLTQWNFVATVTSDSNGLIYHQDTGLSNEDIRFYRVKRAVTVE